MCLIIWCKSKAIKVPLEHVAAGWSNNPDGAGIMWSEKGGSIRCVKGLMRLKDLKTELQSINGKYQFGLHLRTQTHGAISKDMTHPFPFHEGFLMHNGIFYNEPKETGESDTSAFVRRMTKVFGPNWSADNDQCHRFWNLVGPNQKVLFLGNRYVTTGGNWVNVAGVEYSNQTYLPRPRASKSSYARGEYAAGNYYGDDYYKSTYVAPERPKDNWVEQEAPLASLTPIEDRVFILNPEDFACTSEQALDVAIVMGRKDGVFVDVDVKHKSSPQPWFCRRVREELAHAADIGGEG